MGVLPLHGAALLGLLDLQLGEEAHEPFEGSLLTVYPVEVNLQHKRFLLKRVETKGFISHFLRNPLFAVSRILLAAEVFVKQEMYISFL